MKRFFIALTATLIMASSCGLLANMDSTQLASAAGNMLSAASITDSQIVELSQQSVSYMDASNTIDNGAYMKRLSNLLSGVTIEGLPLNFKVYKLNEVNAFACGDGSIRVYSALMDIMDDDELMAIIGHEIGHVVHKDTKKAMKKAYMTSAARDVVNAAGGAVGILAQSALGDLAESYVGAQYSQKQEYAADDFGFNFAVQTGHSPYSMANALNKLVKLSQSTQASAVQKMFSSHPDSESRAAKMTVKAQSYIAKGK